MRNAFADAPVGQPSYRLPFGVHIAEVGRKAIFLDLNNDKYQAIDRTSFRALAPYLAGPYLEGPYLTDNAADNGVEPGERQKQLLRSMIDRGLLTSAPHAGRQVAQITHDAPRRHVMPDQRSVAAFRRAVLVTDLFRTAIRCDRKLRDRPLAACIEQIGEAKAACRPTATLPSWLPYLLHARFYYPADLICLRDSFMLMNFLLARGISADWVFGVQADPFSAHCWVQIGDLAINDDIERVVRFTPILVV